MISSPKAKHLKFNFRMAEIVTSSFCVIVEDGFYYGRIPQFNPQAANKTEEKSTVIGCLLHVRRT